MSCGRNTKKSVLHSLGFFKAVVNIWFSEYFFLFIFGVFQININLNLVFLGSLFLNPMHL